MAAITLRLYRKDQLMDASMRDGAPNLLERMHGAVRQLTMDGQAGRLGALADDLIDLCLKGTPSWATVVPIEQLVRLIKRDLRVWDQPRT